MKKPNSDDYGAFYDGKEPTSEYARYSDNFARWQEKQSAAAAVIHALAVADGVGLTEDDFGQALLGEHRTHQQQAVRTIAVLLWGIESALCAMAEMEYDDRNAGMVRYAKAAIEATKGVPLPYI